MSGAFGRGSRFVRSRRAAIALAWCALAPASAALLPGCGERGGDRERVVEFWTISLRPTFTGYMEERIGAFEASRPGVRVRWVDVPFSSVERKLLAAAAAGRAPDVVNLSDMMFARYAGAGAFEDLSDDLGPGVLGRYHEGALSVGRLGGELLALPWYLTTQSLIYNRALLEEGGLEPGELPRTWGGLVAAAGPYYERTGRWLFTQPIGTDSQLPVMLMSEGIVPFGLDGEGLLRASVAREEVAGYLGEWVSLYRAGALPRESATRGFEHLIDVYQDERVAVVNTGANFLGRVRDVSRGVYERTGVAPPAVGALGAAHVAVMPVCVSARSEEPELSREWLVFITSPESQSMFARLAAILPSTRASLDDPFFGGPTAEEEAAGLETVGEARSLIAGELGRAVAFTPALESWPDLRRVFNERFKRVLLDGADLEEELAAIEADWDRIIDEMNARRAASGGEPAGVEALPVRLRGVVQSGEDGQARRLSHLGGAVR